QWLRDRETRVVHDEVEAAKTEDCLVDCGQHCVGVGDIGGDAERDIGAAELGGCVARLMPVEIGDHHASAIGDELCCDCASDATCRAGHKRDPAGVPLRCR